jgi:hypothetical protein
VVRVAFRLVKTGVWSVLRRYLRGNVSEVKCALFKVFQMLVIALTVA